MLTDILRYFIQRETEGSTDTAQSWVTTIIVITVLTSIVILGIKHFTYNREGNLYPYWIFKRNILLFVAGLILTFFIYLSLWYLSFDYSYFLGIPGLMNGTILGWIIYFTVFAAVHILYKDWREKFFSRRK